MIAFILVAAFLFKLPFLFNPLLGYFGSYQVVNAMMAEMMVWPGDMNWFVPRLTVLMEGEPALHLLYYPFGSMVAALLHKIASLPMDFAGRFQAAFFMGVNGWLLWHIARDYFDKKWNLFLVFLFSFLPMNMLMGINFQNESIAVTFLLLSWLLISREDFGSIALAGLLFSLAMVARLHFFLIFPVFFMYLFIRSRLKAVLLFFFAAIPMILWCGWLYVVQEQNPDPVMTSMFSQAGDGRVLMSGMFFRASFYHRMLGILCELWLTPILVPFFLIGLRWAWDRHRHLFFWSLLPLFAILLFPQKVYDHPFYLIGALPAASMLVTQGLNESLIFLGKRRVLIIGIFFLGFAMRYFVPSALSSGNEQALRIEQIGQEVGEQIPVGAEVIAQQGTSPELLYYSGRQGWSLDIKMADRVRGNRLSQIKNRDKGYGNLIAWLGYLIGQGADYLLISDISQFKREEEFYRYVTNNFEEITLKGRDYQLFRLVTTS